MKKPANLEPREFRLHANHEDKTVVLSISGVMTGSIGLPAEEARRLALALLDVAEDVENPAVSAFMPSMN